MKTTTFLTFVGDQCGKAEEAIKHNQLLSII